MELPPQRAHVGFDDVLGPSAAVPDRVQQLLLRHRLFGIPRELGQHVDFTRGQRTSMGGICPFRLPCAAVLDTGMSFPLTRTIMQGA